MQGQEDIRGKKVQPFNFLKLKDYLIIFACGYFNFRQATLICFRQNAHKMSTLLIRPQESEF